MTPLKRAKQMTEQSKLHRFNTWSVHVTISALSSSSTASAQNAAVGLPREGSWEGEEEHGRD